MTKKNAEKQTCLLLADLISGTTILFGITVEANTYEEAIRKVVQLLNLNEGKRFIEIEHPQIFIKKQYVICPGCQGVIPMAELECPNCKQDTRSPAFLQAVKEGSARIITKVQQEMRSELEGTIDAFRVRAEHIVLYDFVPKESMNYMMWCKVAEESIKRAIARRSGLELPSAEQTLAINKGQS